MNTCLNDLIFSESLSEEVKLDLLDKLLGKISSEEIVENLFLNSGDVNDYLYILENIPRIGAFKEIKRAFWKRLSCLDESLIFEVSIGYIERPLRTAEKSLQKTKERATREEDKANKIVKKEQPIGLAGINRIYDRADRAKKDTEQKENRLKTIKARVDKLVSGKGEHDKKVKTKAELISKAKELANRGYKEGIGSEDTEKVRKSAYNRLNGGEQENRNNISSSTEGKRRDTHDFVEPVEPKKDIETHEIPAEASRPLPKKEDPQVPELPKKEREPKGMEPANQPEEQSGDTVPAVKPKKRRKVRTGNVEVQQEDSSVVEPKRRGRRSGGAKVETPGKVEPQMEVAQPQQKKVSTKTKNENNGQKLNKTLKSLDGESTVSDEERKSDMRTKREFAESVKGIDKAIAMWREREKQLKLTPGSSKADVENALSEIKQAEDKKKNLQAEIDKINKKYKAK